MRQAARTAVSELLHTTLCGCVAPACQARSEVWISSSISCLPPALRKAAGSFPLLRELFLLLRARDIRSVRDITWACIVCRWGLAAVSLSRGARTGDVRVSARAALGALTHPVHRCNM